MADGAIAQALLHDINQLILVFSDTATGTTQGISRTYNQGIADLATEGASSHNGLYDGRFRNGLMDFLHGFLEHFPVLATFNGGNLGAQQAYLVLAQNALLFQLHSHVQTNLSAQGRQERVRTLTLNDILQKFYADGLHINTVRDMYVGHDGRRVGVN